MLTIEEIREKLSDRNLSEVGRRLGIKPTWMTDFVRNKRPNPSYEMVKKLSDYLEQNR